MLFYQLTSPGTPLNIRRLLTFLRCIGETMMSMKDFPAAVGSVQKSTPRNGTFYTGDWTGCHTGNRKMGRIGCIGLFPLKLSPLMGEKAPLSVMVGAGDSEHAIATTASNF